MTFAVGTIMQRFSEYLSKINVKMFKVICITSYLSRFIIEMVQYSSAINGMLSCDVE